MSSPTLDRSPSMSAVAEPPASATATDPADNGSRQQSQQAAAQEAVDILSRHAHDADVLRL